ncbi:hypothetical protein CPB83DRAFT_857058 [Crepidotus variabilis]|uniref:DUF1776-domain-containing protein n=1 Tax=Crepidotus variabilis TaxID=179855 RepID=A0A9P6EDZ8_9AGAR|nr:hypothetical protein CPB83DRAFT_857058 [Crepidotus variabilis]
MPSLDNVEEYLRSVEEYVYSSLTAVTYSLPDVHEVANKLWVDIARYGPGLPSLPDVNMGSLGPFQVPPPPPPSPPPLSSTWIEISNRWIQMHPWKVSGLTVGAVGVGLYVGYGRSLSKRRSRFKAQKSHRPDSRQVVVVLGGDTPHALPVILAFEKHGYTVIASVSNSDAVGVLESKCNGYVKALVLDPFEPATIPAFLRSLSATLRRKFPINVPGDPFTAPSEIPYVHSIVSLLSLSAPVPDIYAPLEHVSLENTYLPYLTATQITPLQIIQSLLPLLRTGSARSRDYGKKSIVFCLPATDARVGLPFASVQAMSAAGTLRGVEVLCREIKIAALTEKTETMKNIRIVVVDVGSFKVEPAIKSVLSEGVYKSMEDWTASEKMVYGPAFVSVMHENPPPSAKGLDRARSVFNDGYQYGTRRSPTDLSVLADKLVAVVSGVSPGPSIFGIGLGLGRIQSWIRGSRVSVGAGAYTYRIASTLPSIILDALLSLPHVLISIRNRLLPVEPHRLPPADLPTPITVRNMQTIEMSPKSLHIDEEQHDQSSASEPESSSSDADIESNTGDTSESWVSLSSK